MKVSELKAKLHDVPDDAEVVFQANEPYEEDAEGEATYTFALGPVFEAFYRENGVLGICGPEFVIDGNATEREYSHA